MIEQKGRKVVAITIESIRSQVEGCIEDFKRGEMTEESLGRVLEALDTLDRKQQDLLYLQAKNTSLNAEILGMSLMQDGEISEPEPDNWPYETVLDAIRDGWRIIKFPEMALLLDESRTYGLGCEFILEKWQ